MEMQLNLDFVLVTQLIFSIFLKKVELENKLTASINSMGVNAVKE